MNWIKENDKVRSILITLFLLFAATVLGVFFRSRGTPDDMLSIYLFAVFLTASLTNGYVYGIIASLIAALLFYYFFTDPVCQLVIYDARYLLTFFVMLLTSIITSVITSKNRRMLERLKVRDTERSSVCEMSNALMKARSLEEITETATQYLSQVFGCPVFWQDKKAAALEEEPFLRLTVSGEEGVIGYLCMPETFAQRLAGEQNTLLKVMLENVSLAADRMRQIERKCQLDEKVHQEQYRSTLLRSISHDLRTPLSGIMGISEVLIDMAGEQKDLREMGEKVYEDACYLRSMVENVLDLTRLQEGKLFFQKEEQVLEEVIEGAVRRVEESAPEHNIVVELPEQILLVPMDIHLIQQVLMNLLDNAVKHTNPEKEINVAVRHVPKSKEVEICVENEGSLIPEAELKRIFESFYTRKEPYLDKRKGMGLGLAICKLIVEAHGGKIRAENRRAGTGVCFRFTLPLEEDTDGTVSNQSVDR